MRKEEKAHNGQTIRTETGPDRSSHKVDENKALMGNKMRGGVTDLSHSISGDQSQVHAHRGATRRGNSPL